MSYATAEDDIRKILVLIKEEQNTLLVRKLSLVSVLDEPTSKYDFCTIQDLVVRKYGLANSQLAEGEKAQLSGMANVKRACKGLFPSRAL